MTFFSAVWQSIPIPYFGARSWDKLEKNFLFFVCTIIWKAPTLCSQWVLVIWTDLRACPWSKSPLCVLAINVCTFSVCYILEQIILFYDCQNKAAGVYFYGVTSLKFVFLFQSSCCVSVNFPVVELNAPNHSIQKCTHSIFIYELDSIRKQMSG